MTVAAKKTASEGKAKKAAKTKAASKKPRTLKQVLGVACAKVRGVTYYFQDGNVAVKIDGAEVHYDKADLLAKLLQAIGAKPAGA